MMEGNSPPPSLSQYPMPSTLTQPLPPPMPLPLPPSSIPVPAPSFPNNNNYNIVGNLKTGTLDIAILNARFELEFLLDRNEPFWIKSSSSSTDDDDGDGNISYTLNLRQSDISYTLNHCQSDIVYPNRGTFREESSKESAIVHMPPAKLFEIFSDPEKWMNFFSTIVVETDAFVLNPVLYMADALSLIQAKYHTLSPLVEPRKYRFVRHCSQKDHNTWFVVETSYDFLEDASPELSWKFPSGCKIERIPDREYDSRVTWIEHVRVEENYFNNDVLFNEVIKNGQAFGAKRWLVILQRMCERYIFSRTPSCVRDNYRLHREYSIIAGMMNLSDKMVKNFCEILSAPKLTEVYLYRNADGTVNNNGKYQFSFHESQMMSVCSSFRLPIYYKDLFRYFKDKNMRYQWDTLYGESLVSGAERNITTSSDLQNDVITWFEPDLMQGRNSRTILQERCLDRLGGLLIYSPISFEAIINVINGGDISLQPILPSGLVISGDSRQSSTSSDASSVGSILTVALQILVADIPPAELSSGNVRDYGRALMDKTVNKIKANTLHLVI